MHHSLSNILQFWRVALWRTGKLAALLLLAACQSMPTLMPPTAAVTARAPAATTLPNTGTAVMTTGATPADMMATARPNPAQIAASHALWSRIRSGFAIESLGGNAGRLQAVHAQWYRERPEHLLRVFTRARLYLHDIVEATQQASLPMEVALLPVVESAFMPSARSSAAADGLWQFIAATGRRYDLKQHLFLDQRRDVRAATRAAMRYLADLRQRYAGDMQLALAAYNCGEGCIDSQIRKAQARGLPGRFEDLQLNAETANYVPRLIALSKLVAEAIDANQMAKAGLPPMQDAPYFAAVKIHRDIDISRVAQLAGLPLGEFQTLNPQHKKPVIVGGLHEEVLMPVERASAFSEALLNYRGALASWTTLRVNRPTPLSELAARYGTTSQTLREVNGIAKGHLIKAGSTVLVPRRGSGGEITHAVAETAVLQTMPMIVTRKLVVKKGDNWQRLVARLNADGLRVTVAMVHAHNPKLRLRAGTMMIRLPADALAQTIPVGTAFKGLS